MKKGSECKKTYDSVVDVSSTSELPLEGYGYLEFIFLKNCSDNIEADLLISVLNEQGIDAIIKYSDSGSYLNILHGRNFQGADVCVKKEDLDDAQKVIGTFKYSHDLSEEYGKKRSVQKVVAILLVGFLVLQALLGVILNIFSAVS